MNNKNWFIATLSLILLFAAAMIALNFYVDHHAVRLILFSDKKNIHQNIYPDGIDLHMFNPELIFRSPKRFDSFLFGSSRVGVIDVNKIPAGKFYNMSYSVGMLSQHLAILKAFVQRGIKIKSVVIGLDEFCFNRPSSVDEKTLVRIMHPDVSDKSRAKIFFMYFFRKPDLTEITKWKDRVLSGIREGRVIISDCGVNLGWIKKDTFINEKGSPIFEFSIHKYEPILYGQKELDAAFHDIRELISLAQVQHFSITFFITPFYYQKYLNNAEALLVVKEKLARLTSFYDFSGFNSVTINPMDYFEESHYRYKIGDMIISRIYGHDIAAVPRDFGVLVTQHNVAQHISLQKKQIEDYIHSHNLLSN
jgi:hypothetical protein